MGHHLVGTYTFLLQSCFQGSPEVGRPSDRVTLALTVDKVSTFKGGYFRFWATFKVKLCIAQDEIAHHAKAKFDLPVIIKNHNKSQPCAITWYYFEIYLWRRRRMAPCASPPRPGLVGIGPQSHSWDLVHREMGMGWSWIFLPRKLLFSEKKTCCKQKLQGDARWIQSTNSMC